MYNKKKEKAQITNFYFILFSVYAFWKNVLASGHLKKETTYKQSLLGFEYKILFPNQ